MLTAEENDLLRRVEGDPPMGSSCGAIGSPPACPSRLLESDGTPVRTRLLGEDLGVFRDSEGRVGVLDEYCPHRRASLVHGRNEECGLRCLYHGWKFDVRDTQAKNARQ
jgi:phthalate 4,5-dioxygenase oxygenase subunit